ncbi:MAG: (d)CMP kinase [Bacteroidota bacterium]|nr:(d)CMP kinase [Bacteroidota bacterium]
MQSKQIIIAIDGFSSCGKSTVAKQVARILGYNYIDTGAMYRAITLFCLRNELIENQKVREDELINRLDDIHIEFKFNAELQRSETILNGENVEEEIRQLPVSENVSQVSTIGEVRKKMVRLQQEMGSKKGIVMDGRDIGTVVFPNAELKIFMTASPRVRAQRRYDELMGKGQEVSLDEIISNIEMRDHIDQTREESPLRRADDALILDNSHLTHEEQLQWVIDRVNKALENENCH